MIGYRNAGHFATYLIHPPPNRATPAEAGKPKKKRQMLAWLKTMTDRRQRARSLYGSIVTRAREPVFYAAWGVPDTVQGRFEMIALHLVLVLRRLAAEGRAGERLARALTEAFMVDLDDAMREMTFGDLAVPREVKRAAAALFHRHRAYLAALGAADHMRLAQAIGAQLAYLEPGRDLDAQAIAVYVRRCASALDGEPAALILAGQLDWPHPQPDMT
jgi:cytochrome b pre-mRNA-processing protein 3